MGREIRSAYRALERAQRGARGVQEEGQVSASQCSCPRLYFSDNDDEKYRAA